MAWPHIPGLPCALGAPWGSALAEGQAGTQGRWALLEKSHISHLGAWISLPSVLTSARAAREREPRVELSLPGHF